MTDNPLTSVQLHADSWDRIVAALRAQSQAAYAAGDPADGAALAYLAARLHHPIAHVTPRTPGVRVTDAPGHMARPAS